MNLRYVLIGAALCIISGCNSEQDSSMSNSTEAPAPAPVATAATGTAATVPQTAMASDEDAGDWSHFNRELNGQRYSPLKQINRDNVASLQESWSSPASGQVTPIVVDSTMYVPANNTVMAVDAVTGEAKWTYQLPQGRPSARGVAYWPGDDSHPARIVFTSSAYTRGQPPVNSLNALDAATGEPAAEFGDQGVVNLDVGCSTVPTIYRNIVIIGSNTGEVPRGGYANPRAFDAVTGKKLWEFHDVAQPGETGHDSWLDDGWKDRSGTNVWAFNMTVDKERGILYIPVAGPAANYWGGDRPGNGLFGNSLVAVDAETGKYLWHFQLVHHGLWDTDMPSPPALVDISKDGRTIPALAIINKSSLMFFLNRVTGEPVYKVEERPVAKGDAPDEWYSPTQPFPVKPPALSKNSFKPEDIVTAEDTTAQHAAACRDLYDRSGGLRNEGPYTGWLFHKEGDPVKSTIQFPGGTGGVNWGGETVDPTTGYVYVNAQETSLIGWIEKKKPGLNYGRGTEGSDQPYDRASVNGPGPYSGFNAPIKDANGDTVGMLPCWKGPWAHLVAVNANTGEIVWKKVLGLQESLPEGKQKIGGSGNAGPTVTAGGLVFVAATGDKRFRAFDSATGEELWAAKLPSMGNAIPVTYLGSDGKQYVAIVARDMVHVFTLP